jgi:N-acetyl-anhydromuramyl-L-alanine amidase AmpD
METIINEQYVKSPEFLGLLAKVPKITKKYLTNGQYVGTPQVKTGIVIHHTAGMNAQGAWAWWNQTPDRVGTPYLIDRDGSILECFDPKNWAFHLGIKGDDDYQEKCTIPIEIVAAGQLRGPKNNMFYPLFPNLNRGIEINSKEICTLDKEFRGFKTYHAYTDAQIISLCQLVCNLKSLFPTIELPKSLPANFNQYDSNVIVKHQKGIFTHSTVRQDKNDTIPQPNLLLALNATLGYLKK